MYGWSEYSSCCLSLIITATQSWYYSFALLLSATFQILRNSYSAKTILTDSFLAKQFPSQTICLHYQVYLKWFYFIDCNCVNNIKSSRNRYSSLPCKRRIYILHSHLSFLLIVFNIIWSNLFIFRVWNISVCSPDQHCAIRNHVHDCDRCFHMVQVRPSAPPLTHWGRDKMAAISQTTLSIAFFSMNMLEFRLNFHWRSFLRVQLSKFQHWFR